MEDLDILVSICVGLAAGTKAALQYDFEEKVYHNVDFAVTDGDFVKDICIPFITGTINSFTDNPARILLLAVHRASELVSGLCLAVLFHWQASYGTIFSSQTPRRSAGLNSYTKPWRIWGGRASRWIGSSRPTQISPKS